MKNRTILVVYFIIIFSITNIKDASAQRNANPDPLGEPWWTADATKPAHELTYSTEFCPTIKSLANILPDYIIIILHGFLLLIYSTPATLES